jgi:hypothetical protein
MILPLEQLLRQDCEKEELDLHKLLERVKVSGRQIWKEPRLSWYTDHGFSHSQRVVDLLGQIVEHLQTTEKRLSPSDLFVVLAACYLHDIGMQDLNINGREVETLGPDDYEFIRRRHPGRAYDLIIERTVTLRSGQFWIDLDCSRSCVKSIALVSQGHGSEFFEKTLDDFARSRYQIRRWTVRGDLLTALLLMADELDLQEERARPLPEMRSSSISSMHHHVHFCITSIQVAKGDTNKQRCIRIWFEYPKDSIGYAKKIRRWLVGKLYRQCQITAPIVKSSTDGELEWCEQIGYHEVFARKKEVRPALPQRALLELERALVDRETVGYASELDTLKSMVLESTKYRTLCLISKDEGAKEQLIKWLRAHCASQGILLRPWNPRHSATTPKDIAIRLHKWLRAQASSVKRSDRQQKRDAQFVESTPLATLCDMIAKDLDQFAARQRIVLLFENVDSAAPDTAHWIERDFTSKLAERDASLQVILTYSEACEVEETLPEHRVLIPLGNFSKEDIAAHYRQEFGLSEIEAEEKAQHIYKPTEGEPWRIITWLGSEREKRAKVFGEGEEA